MNKPYLKVMDENPAAAALDVDLITELAEKVPSFDLSHIKRLTNHVGILQHATYITPNYHHGYCIDDNARALILALMAFEKDPSEDHHQLISTYLAYINYMQLENGKFRNFLSFSHVFLDDEGTEDAMGRTIWSLGYLLKNNVNTSFHKLGREIFDRAVRHLDGLRSPRAVGYSLLGLVHLSEKSPEDGGMKELINRLAHYLAEEYQQNSTAEWSWYEKVISYDNAILPLSLLRASVVLENESLKLTAMESFHFLDNILFKESYLSIIGNASWYSEGGSPCIYGQQPIEVTSLVLLYEEMYSITLEKIYKQRMLTSFLWFFGKNKLGLQLYDPSSGGCCDGLDSHGVNLNQGAESTICFWLAYLNINRLLS
ncbi:hypothetical protein ACR79M_16475 [Sphingobacterium spiritivorum]|uniref:hypothetical protein n=1 Tax=Sphingobacterium spiritivorum TaxID=258 RepID=UPI003DA51E38